jgi:hypothetical protein
MLSDMAQELQSTYQALDQPELITARDSLLRGRYLLVRSIAVSTNSSVGEVFTKMGL